MPASLSDLDSKAWRRVADAVDQAAGWLAQAPPGGNKVVEKVVEKVVALGSHPKWEVRLAVARLAGESQFSELGPALDQLTKDEHSRVRVAAEEAFARRRDLVRSSVFTREHEHQIASILEVIGKRFGPKGRVSVARASEKIADTFARELSHELVRLLSPILISVEQLRAGLTPVQAESSALLEALETLERRVEHFGDVLASARNYTAQPKLTFSTEHVLTLIEESVGLVEAKWNGAQMKLPRLVVREEAEVGEAELSRTRFIQALVNLLENAIESYAGRDHSRPIGIDLKRVEARLVIVISDEGCGMSAARLADARRLFATSKPGGSGFGLPLAIKIVQTEHQGALSLESVEGKGTSVRLVVPLRHSSEGDS